MTSRERGSQLHVLGHFREIYGILANRRQSRGSRVCTCVVERNFYRALVELRSGSWKPVCGLGVVVEKRGPHCKEWTYFNETSQISRGKIAVAVEHTKFPKMASQSSSRMRRIASPSTKQGPMKATLTFGLKGNPTTAKSCSGPSSSPTPQRAVAESHRKTRRSPDNRASPDRNSPSSPCFKGTVLLERCPFREERRSTIIEPM